MSKREYLCKDCRDSFEEEGLTLAHNTEPITCPRCGSEDVEQELPFYPDTFKKSA
jgi:DNA-directed RNA polymerase subunit RPC12/RpoP